MGLFNLFSKKESDSVTSTPENEQNSDAKINDIELIQACNNCKEDIAIELIKAGANINSKDANNGSALSRAISNGLVDTANLLLEKGCDVATVDNDGWSPLYDCATNMGDLGIVSQLLKNGGNPNIHPKPKKPILITALEKGFDDIAKVLIENGAANSSGGDDGWTPLECAESRGYTEIISLLKG